MRFFKPSIASWKYTKDRGVISNEEKNDTVRKGIKFFDWQLSFTKTCVQVAFIIFVIANLFILSIMTINFICNGSIEMLESYINNVFVMFESVIGGYIIKSATENSLKIVMSVLSDYVEKKYGTKLIDVYNTDTYSSDEEDVCEAKIDTDTYDELINKELEKAIINTSGKADDDSSRFTAGTQIYGASDKDEEVNR